MQLLVALAVLLQEKSAEETFRKIEETITKARTIWIEFELTRKVRDEVLEGSGTLLLQEGNKINFDVMTFHPGEVVAKQIFASDGANAKYTKPIGEDAWTLEQKRAPEHLAGSFHVTLFQLPLLDSFMITAGARDGLADLRKVVKIGEFNFGEGGKEGSLLKYGGSLDLSGREKFDPRGMSFEVKLWYDPKTWIPRKREVTLKLAGVVGTTTETYTGFVLNKDIPKQKFDLSALGPRTAEESTPRREK
jgi:outer membrane lipoprotein-sorting protein